MLEVNRRPIVWVVLGATMPFCVAAYAQQTHAFGDDLAEISLRTWAFVVAAIAAGILARFTVGRPEDEYDPHTWRTYTGKAIVSTVAGLLAFGMCEALRDVLAARGIPMSDGLEVVAIALAAFNHKRTLDGLSRAGAAGFRGLADKIAPEKGK